MKNLIMGIAVSIIFIGLVVSTIWFHDLYKQEKERTVKAQGKIKELEYLVKANEKNTDVELTKTANEFIETLFLSTKNNAEDHERALLELTTGRATSRISESQTEALTANMEMLEGFTSEAHINESFYNRINSTQGKVVIEFEQWLSFEGNTDKTLNKAIIELEYIDDLWHVSDFEIQPLL